MGPSMEGGGWAAVSTFAITLFQVTVSGRLCVVRVVWVNLVAVALQTPTRRECLPSVKIGTKFSSSGSAKGMEKNVVSRNLLRSH